MAEGRLLNKSVATDERLNALSRDAMLLYLMTVPHLDRDGLIDGRPRVLWAMVAPLQDAWIQGAGALVDEWVSAGLVVRFEDDRKPVLFFPGFAKNQRLVYQRERESRFACPPGYTRTKTGLCADDVSARDEVMQQSRLGRAQGDSDDTDARELVMTNSRPTRAQSEGDSVGARDEVMPNNQDHNQDQDVVGADQIMDAHPRSGTGGSAEGGESAPAALPQNGLASVGDLLYAYTDHQLRTAAWELGAELGLQAEWTGYEKFLAGRNPAELGVLLEWIGFYRDMPEEAFAKIHSLTALIRSNINKGNRAPLTGAQRRGLAEAIAHAIAVSEPYDP